MELMVITSLCPCAHDNWNATQAAHIIIDAAVSDVLASAVVRALSPPRNDTAATTLMKLGLLIFVLIKATDICAN